MKMFNWRLLVKKITNYELPYRHCETYNYNNQTGENDNNSTSLRGRQPEAIYVFFPDCFAASGSQ